MRISPALRAFLDLIAWSEGTSTSLVTQDRGYDVIVSGIDGLHRMTDYNDHPFAAGRPPIVVRSEPLLESTASGRYQLLLRYWRDYKNLLALPDFSPDSQDAVAARQIGECYGLELIAVGDIAGAIKACSRIWASFPGNAYGQSTHSLELLLDKYAEFAKAQGVAA